MDGYEVADSAAGKGYFRPWAGVLNLQELDVQIGHLPPFFAWLNDATAGYLSEYVMSMMKNGLCRKHLGVYWPGNFDAKGEVLDDGHQEHWGKKRRDGDSSPTELESGLTLIGWMLPMRRSKLPAPTLLSPAKYAEESYGPGR